MDLASAFTNVFVSLTVAFATAGLGWWQWRLRRDKELAGMYVNPLILAAEDLQSRLYNVLERNGLGTMRSRMSSEEIALETLYLAARYFGWERVVHQHGPFTSDQTFVGLTQALRKTFATDRTEIGPFCLFRTEQSDLGQLVVRPSESGPGFQALPLHEFSARLEETGLAERAAIRDSLNAFTGYSIDLPVRERLARAQAELADLLEHLERKKQIKPFGGDRRKRARLHQDFGGSVREAA